MVIRKITKKRQVSLDAFPLFKKANFHALIIKCLCEKKDIDFNEFHKKLKEADVEKIWNLNDNDVGLNELMIKERKGRVQICTERIMKVLEKF